ncbi:MAG: 4-hydroxythreonine-4-phosphate dehydrogenase PdxA [Bacteroidales bacterium]
MEKDTKIQIGITQGDYNSVNYEAIIRSFVDLGIMELCHPLVFGLPKIATAHIHRLAIPDFSFQSIKQFSEFNAKRANIFEISTEEAIWEYGKSTEMSAKYAFLALQKAMEYIETKQLKALITMPLNSEELRRLQGAFKNQTQYLKTKSQASSIFKIAIADSLRMCAISSTEIDDPSIFAIDKIQQRILQFYTSLKTNFSLHTPRIAILSLSKNMNDTYISKDDSKILVPIVEEAFMQGMPVFGPYPAQTFFASSDLSKFDGVICMYKEQMNCAFLEKSSKSLVYFTEGLPFVHLEPAIPLLYTMDKNMDTLSENLLQTIYQTIDILRSREQYAQLTKKPLAIEKKEKE